MARFRVKELARQQGLTAEALAWKSGVKLSTIQGLWQNKTREPSFSTLAGLARALGVSMDDLVFPEAIDGRMDGREHTNGDGTKNRAPDVSVLA